MRRISLVVLVICGAAIGGGCRGSNNSGSLFSPYTTRVPSPGTKSVSSSDSNYYSKPTQSGQPAIGTGSSLTSSSSTELAWQPPRPKTADGGATIPFTGETNRSGVSPAGYIDPASSNRGVTLSESAMRVVENSAPANFTPPSSALKLGGMKASEVKQPAGPPRATDAAEPVEISQLPAAIGPQPLPYRPGSTGIVPDGSDPNASPANNLRWRSRS